MAELLQMEKTEGEIILHYMELEAEYYRYTKEDAWKMVEQLVGNNFKVNRDSEPLREWLKYICLINDYEFTLPVPLDIANAILDCADARKFMWAIT